MFVIRQSSFWTFSQYFVVVQRYAATMKVHRERLMGDLIGVLNRLQMAQRNAVAKEKESMKAVAAQDQQVSHQVTAQIFFLI